METILCGHDYDGIGWRIHGRDDVKAALCKCVEYVKTYHCFVEKQGEEGTDNPEIARKLIETVGCGYPERLFMALYTVEQHRTHQTEACFYE